MKRDAAKGVDGKARALRGLIVWHSRGSTVGEGNVVLKERKKKRQ
jgi:hypothetical protein